jgi:hypothetical protein
VAAVTGAANAYAGETLLQIVHKFLQQDYDAFRGPVFAVAAALRYYTPSVRIRGAMPILLPHTLSQPIRAAQYASS